MNYNILKKIITVSVVAMILASTLTVICTNRNYNAYVEENNRALLQVVTLILEQGKIDKTEIEKDDIVQYLEGVGEIEDLNLTILQDYGYTLDTRFFLDNNEKNLKSNLLQNLVVVNVCIAILMFFLYWYLKHREEKINHLIFYLQELQEKNYTLKINENEEEELSKLQNEIYKIMILLKEQAENSLLDKAQVKNNIVDISHQLKTPLTSMSIMLDNLVEYPEMDEETKGVFLQNIRERIAHMELLIQNLLKLSRLDANVVEFTNKRIKVQDLIEHAVEKNRILLEQKNINLVITGGAQIELVCDTTWQSEALSNVIKNAIEHSYQEGEIEISFTQNNFMTIIKIRDYGTGIKKESLKKIFTRFYKETEASEQSMGVGLNLARTIIEKNQGSITVSSKEHEGATFEIRYARL